MKNCLSAPPSANLPVIVFVGPIGCGKTTIADVWREEYSNWVPLNFADALRKTIELVYGIPFEEQKLSANKKKPYPQLGGRLLREALQQLGTEGFRRFHPPTWVEAWGRAYETLNFGNDRPRGLIVEDLRFLNEFELLAQLPDTYFVPIYNMQVSMAWRQHIQAADAPCNKLKAKLLRWLPFLKNFGMEAITIHQSEREIADVMAAVERMPKHRVVPVDNSEYGLDSVKRLVQDMAVRLCAAIEQNENQQILKAQQG